MYYEETLTLREVNMSGCPSSPEFNKKFNVYKNDVEKRYENETDGVEIWKNMPCTGYGFDACVATEIWWIGRLAVELFYFSPRRS